MSQDKEQTVVLDQEEITHASEAEDIQAADNTSVGSLQGDASPVEGEAIDNEGDDGDDTIAIPTFPTRRIHIGNVDRTVTRDDLLALFDKYKPDLTEVWVARHPSGFAFVTINANVFDEFMATFDKVEVGGRALSMAEAKSNGRRDVPKRVEGGRSGGRSGRNRGGDHSGGRRPREDSRERFQAERRRERDDDRRRGDSEERRDDKRYRPERDDRRRDDRRRDDRDDRRRDDRDDRRRDDRDDRRRDDRRHDDRDDRRRDDRRRDDRDDRRRDDRDDRRRDDRDDRRRDDRDDRRRDDRDDRRDSRVGRGGGFGDARRGRR